MLLTVPRLLIRDPRQAQRELIVPCAGVIRMKSRRLIPPTYLSMSQALSRLLLCGFVSSVELRCNGENGHRSCLKMYQGPGRQHVR